MHVHKYVHHDKYIKTCHIPYFTQEKEMQYAQCRTVMRPNNYSA